ncbi:MAG TPA: cytochrome ubiquinol oxidase subunit I [Nitrospira sp.]|nr:cytochrome ubiquinol oxidase subunit I [Nitrospira sp.]
MDLDPLNIPMLYGRIAIAAAALSHGLFATLVVGSAVIGAAVATMAYLTDRPSYRRLAHTIAFALVVSTATISFLGVSLIFALNIFWPRFWHRIFRIMFWPFVLEAGLFLGEAVFAYSWFYLWDWSTVAGWRRRLHLTFAWLAALCAVVAMFLIDITASYMLTPHPPDSAWANILNPTMIHLDLHRWFGNLTWAGFTLAALCAIGFLRAGTPEDRTHYRWAAAFCFAIGFGALLIMPLIGYHYLLNLRYGQPQAFHVLMLGRRSWLFDLVALLYGLLVFTGSGYIASVVFARAPTESMARAFLPLSLAVLGAAALLLAQPYHLQHVPGLWRLTDQVINPWGKMQPHKYFALTFLVLFGLANWLYFLRWFPQARQQVLHAEHAGRRERRQSYLLITVAVAAMAIMLGMGWVRESARAVDGYLIYGYMTFADERPTYEGCDPCP